MEFTSSTPHRASVISPHSHLRVQTRTATEIHGRIVLLERGGADGRQRYGGGREQRWGGWTTEGVTAAETVERCGCGRERTLDDAAGTGVGGSGWAATEWKEGYGSVQYDSPTRDAMSSTLCMRWVSVRPGRHHSARPMRAETLVPATARMRGRETQGETPGMSRNASSAVHTADSDRIAHCGRHGGVCIPGDRACRVLR